MKRPPKSTACHRSLVSALEEVQRVRHFREWTWSRLRRNAALREVEALRRQVVASREVLAEFLVDLEAIRLEIARRPNNEPEDDLA